MNKLRAKFSKGQNARYISHLDTLRTFERAIRRAGLPISYTMGFNPHQQLTFGLPLSVGTLSDCEYVDIILEKQISVLDFVTVLNQSLPDGLEILDADYVDTDKNIMAMIHSAEYEVILSGVVNLDEYIKDLMKKNEVYVKVEKKGKEKNVDIRKDIHKLEAKSKDVLYMRLSAGSSSNLKPENVVKALEQLYGLDLQIEEIRRLTLLYD